MNLLRWLVRHTRPQPDYQRIADLERELGLIEVDERDTLRDDRYQRRDHERPTWEDYVTRVIQYEMDHALEQNPPQPTPRYYRPDDPELRRFLTRAAGNAEFADDLIKRAVWEERTQNKPMLFKVWTEQGIPHVDGQLAETFGFSDDNLPITSPR